MDDVKRLLADFADRAVEGLPPADVDADVARGRRALRRIKARRRTTGVLCIAAATTAVLAIGNQASRWGGGEAEVATDSASTATAAAPQSVPSTSPAPTPPPTEGSISLYSTGAIRLVANQQTWSGLGCTLAPEGWTPEKPIGASRVVLTPPSARASDASAKLVLQASTQSQQLTAVRSLPANGKTLQLGKVGARSVGQVKLDTRWLVLQLPAGANEWTDDVVGRFMGSCSFR